IDRRSEAQLDWPEKFPKPGPQRPSPLTGRGWFKQAVEPCRMRMTTRWPMPASRWSRCSRRNSASKSYRFIPLYSLTRFVTTNTVPVVTVTSPDEFNVEFDDESAAELRRRLLQTRWPTPADGMPEDAGTDAQALRDVVAAWSEFDVQACAQSLNEFHHVRVTVDGEQVHAVHERGKGPRPFPIVLTHGWPSTFWEYSALIPLLT